MFQMISVKKSGGEHGRHGERTALVLGREKLYRRLPIHRHAELETEWRARPTSILFGILPSVPIAQSLAMYPDSLL